MTELLRKYLNSVRVFEAPNDQGNKEPEKPTIKVDSVDNRKDKDANPDVVDNRGDDEEDEEKDEEDEKKDELTDEQKAAAKEERRQARVQKRIDKLTAQNANAQNEIAALKKQLEEKPKEGLSEEEVERRATKRAEEIANAREADRKQKEYLDTAKNLVTAANKIDKEFEKNINAIADETGVRMPQYMVEILAELDHKNGDEILVQLSKDDDLYEEICGLTERKMTRRLERMSEELKKNAKPAKPKERERLPDPIEPVDGNRNRGNNIPSKPTQNMDEYVRVRAAQTAEARKQGKNIW